MPDLTGRVALVTGARRGIGLACAQALAEAGASVALADLVQADVERAVAGLAAPATAHEVDVADAHSVARLVDDAVATHGRLDIVVNAAGRLDVAPFVELSPEAWDRTFAVNARGSFLVAQEAARVLIRQEAGGRIILVGSIVAHTARLNNVAYCASKAAIIQAARCMALELAPYRITVNVLSPGSTETEMLVETQTRGDPELLEGVVRGNLAEWRLGIPLGRLASPHDQAAMAVFLASDAAGHITGQEFAVDGGQSVV